MCLLSMLLVLLLDMWSPTTQRSRIGLDMHSKVIDTYFFSDVKVLRNAVWVVYTSLLPLPKPLMTGPDSRMG